MKVTTMMEIIGRPAYVRILMLLRKDGRLRFSQIEHVLALNPKTVDAALKELRRGLWVVPVTSEDAPGGKILVHYELSKRGRALVELLEDIHDATRKRQRALGADTVREVDALFA